MGIKTDITLLGQSLRFKQIIRQIAPAIVLICLLLVMGCTKRVSWTNNFDGNLPPTRSDDVKVYEIGQFDEPSQPPYKILGKVRARRWGNALISKSEGAIQKDMVKAAANMGADAIIEYYNTKQDHKTLHSVSSRWASGLAIKFLQPGEALDTTRPKFIAAIVPNVNLDFETWKKIQVEAQQSQRQKRDSLESLSRHSRPKPSSSRERPITHEEFVKDSTDALVYASVLALAARYELEKKGYYGHVTRTYNPLTVAHLDSLDDKTLQTMHGQRTEYILLVDIVDISGTNVGFFASSGARLRACMYSKSDRSVIWEEDGTGSGKAVGLIGILFNWGTSDRERRSTGIMKAATKCFATLDCAPMADCDTD